MTFGMRHPGRSILSATHSAPRLLLAVLGLATLSGATSQPQPVATPGEQSVSYHEVRLRKLHLVRPDLIPYPVAYDIYC